MNTKSYTNISYISSVLLSAGKLTQCEVNEVKNAIVISTKPVSDKTNEANILLTRVQLMYSELLEQQITQ